MHREENINSKNFLKIAEILNILEKKYNIPIIVSTHPRTRNKIKELNYKFEEKIRFLKPLSYSNYVNLQINSKAVLSDSGTINEESSILNFPALNIREAHERPEAMEEASVMMTGVSIERIIQAIDILSFQKRGSDRTLNLVKDYDIKNVSEKILRIIHSYTDYIKKNIWKEN
jgi:UDP-N-acetylglucosamine 2-epimerase (non-hydrolysing)